MYTLVDSGFISQKLETNEYFPVMLSSKKACINSALVCQNIVLYLLRHYPERFHVYEHSPIAEIRLIPD